MTNLAECVDKLNGAGETERCYAAEDIGYLNAAAGVPPLLKRIGREPSSAVREAIFQALIRIDSEAAIEAAVGLFESDDPQIRNQAVVVLRRKGTQAVPFLAAAMRSGDKDIRKLVLDVLSGMRMVEAGEIYAAALDDPDPNVVITAVENLGRMRAMDYRGRVEELLLRETHPMLTAACIEALVELGQPASLAAIPGRSGALAAAPDFLLSSYLKAIAALGTADDLAEVAQLLATRGAHLRPAILGALLTLHSRGPTPEPPANLIPALQAVANGDDPPLCRYQAVLMLGAWAARDEVGEFLAGCLSNAERLVRLAAVEAIRKAERPEWRPLLAQHGRTEADEEILQALNG